MLTARQFTPLALLGLILLITAPAGAETPAEFDRRIVAELRARDAAAADRFEKANAARERGDHQTAIDLYGQVREQHPGFTHATRRLAGEMLAVNRRAEAIDLCREAAQVDPSPLNQAALAGLLVSVTDGKPPSESDQKTARAMCESLVRFAGDDLGVQQLCAPVAFSTGDVASAIAAAANLERLAPDELQTAFYAAVAHATQGEFLRADLDLRRARERGLPEGEFLRLRGAFHDAWPIWLTVSYWTASGVAGWLVVAALLLVAGLLLSRATLAEAQRIAGAQPAGPGSQGGRLLRGVYTVVLGIAGTAYFLSLPLLLAVVLLVGGGLLAAILAVGHIPIKFVLLLIVMIGATCWSILKSLVLLSRDEEPGLRVDLAEHPRLTATLEEVAEQIGTRPVDSVYLLPGTQFAVMERGGLLGRFKGRSERCLLIGVGVLEGFRLRPFKAVLAHEYGHFVNKDTAGGRFSLAVRRSIHRMAQSLAQSGAASWLNPAWLFLVAFGRLFQRISQGASRLQEVMADRWAVVAYGAQPFCDGLRHVIERSVRFDAHVGAALAELQERQTAPANLYAYNPASEPSEVEVQPAVDDALNASPSPYDSHPSPKQRFEWARLVGGPGAVVESGSEDAWALFADRGSVEVAMTRRVFAQA